jgi:hypothetical protein
MLKSVEDAALAMASVYRALRVILPSEMRPARDGTLRRFQELLAQVQPFDLVIDEETADGEPARVSRTSVCGSWGAVAGTVRYFADRFGVPRAAIEGTQVPRDLVRRYATGHPAEVVFVPERSQTPLVMRRRVTYFGFELEREDEPLREWHGSGGAAARTALAAALARGDALHPAVRRHRSRIDEIREVWRRSGGATASLGQAELTALYADALGGVGDVHQWRASRLDVDFGVLVSREERDRWMSLPGAVEIRDRAVPIEYDVETDESGRTAGVARLRLPEKMARTLVAEELPVLDRPLRFVVHRGARGAVRAATLDALQVALDEPYTDDERRGTRDAGRNRTDRPRRKGTGVWRGRRRPRRG